VKLLIGPAGSGKTTYLLERAHEAMRQGKRVWWVGLPGQRAYLYRRATEGGAVLGLEFLSSQQVYYRLLANALKLKPLVVGTGRIALVGEALKELTGELPAPGEARLFTRAIAEAKRFGLSWRDVDADDAERARFKAVFRAYEQVKGERWDYDDFRSEAFSLASQGGVRPEADLIIVDGFRELGPLELGLYGALGKETAKTTEVWLSLPEAPPGVGASEALSARTAQPARAHHAANPVAEARWVLRALKRDLASGADPLSLAVVLPEREVRAFAALADEYGVPLMDETPKALADTPGGRLLLDLLELPDYPTPSKLLALPELVPLANAALRRALAGREALTLLAKDLGLERAWSAWLARLETPGDELAWARELLESLPELSRHPQGGWQGFKAHALERAKEAAQLAKGAQFRAWWGTLLQETTLFDRPKGGVALLTPTLVSGRRFRKVYLMRALEGAYRAGEGEDYFTPEEARRPLREVFARFGLPKRFLGRDALLFAELLTRGDEVIVTYPEADQGGPRAPELALTGGASPLPELPAGSPLELGRVASFAPTLSPVPLGPASLQALSRYSDCGFRYWAERFVERETPWWRALVRDLRALERFSGARLEALCSRYPEAAGWLSEVEAELTPLSFGVTLPAQGDGPFARLDAAGRTGRVVRLYTFVEPGELGAEAAQDFFTRQGRWNELWASAYLLEQHRVARVHLYLWPVLGAPVAAFEGGIDHVWRRMRSLQGRVRGVYARFAAGDVSPKPGYGCRSCEVFDLCRVGER